MVEKEIARSCQMVNSHLTHLVETEMERDAGISHGASAFLRERLMYVSDGYQTAFCKTCGTFAINDATTRQYKTCRLCGDDSFGRCTIPYAYKLLMHLLSAMAVNLAPEFETLDERVTRIFRGREIIGGDMTDIHTELEEADEGLAEEEEEFADEGLEGDYGEAFD
ncbi:MAG: hypothetical protein ABIQ41_12460 [Gemmatimonadales bacterium]